MCDLSHCCLNKVLPNYRQYCTCKTCGGHCWSLLWPHTRGLQDQDHAKPRKVMISPQPHPPAASLPPEAEEQQAHHQVDRGVVQGGHWDPRRLLPLHCPGHPAHRRLPQWVSGGQHSVICPILRGHADPHQGIPQQQAMGDEGCCGCTQEAGVQAVRMWNGRTSETL